MSGCLFSNIGLYYNQVNKGVDLNKLISIKEAVSKIKDGSVLLFGGFLGCGSPHKVIDELISTGVKDLTIVCNDTAFVDYGVGRLVVSGQLKKVIVSHMGTNKETGRQMNEGIIEVELVPQGTLAERVRAGGAGLGGVLTPIGIGTPVEEGKQKVTVDGKEYLLEKPIKGDFALLFGSKVDKKGNIFYNAATRNFNPLMATAADVVIVEAEQLVEVGDIAPEHVVTPDIFVDYIVQ